jgi:hypothetical protein
MNLLSYQLEIDSQALIFEFVSEGKRGNICKLVQYTAIEGNNIYNLAFGDKDLQTGEIDDTTISNNGDSEKVLATVAKTVYFVTAMHPNYWIFATGSTPSRTRLYRMGISKYYNLILQDFELYGFCGDTWEEFILHKEYSAFLIKRKQQEYENKDTRLR